MCNQCAVINVASGIEHARGMCASTPTMAHSHALKVHAKDRNMRVRRTRSTATAEPPFAGLAVLSFNVTPCLWRERGL